MDYFHYRGGQLYCEEIPVAQIVAKYKTPVYIYSLQTLIRHIHVTSQAFGVIPHIICYAAKANPNLALLKVAALCGAGCDVVSGPELQMSLESGIRHDRIVFSGVGKTVDDIEKAIRAKILFLSVESIEELETISELGRKLKRVVPVSVRVNPSIDPGTHPYVATGLKESKFGLDERLAKSAYRMCHKDKWLNPIGISMHIGSQVESVRPYVDSAKKIVDIYKYLWKQSIRLQYIDIGGGWAAHFEKNVKLPHPDDYVSAVKGLFSGLPITVIAEPGRSLVGNAGILIMKVIRTKRKDNKDFCIVDAGMNDFIRPALYGAYHRIEPVVEHKGPKTRYDIVGPVCENTDFFAKGINLPRLKTDDLLALHTAGAYGSAMSSNYNSRFRGAEIAVAGKKAILIKERETLKDLTSGQHTMGIDDRLIRSLL